MVGVAQLDAYAEAVNGSGSATIMGTFAARWQNGGWTHLGGFPFPSSGLKYCTPSIAYAINGAGQITGSSYVDVDPQEASANLAQPDHAFLSTGGAYDPDDTDFHLVDLGTLGGWRSEGHGINSSGQIIGSSTVSQNDPYYATHAFLWGPGSGMQDLGTFGGVSNQFPNGYSYPTGINDSGHVVGESLATNGYAFGFLWKPDTGLDLLDYLVNDYDWVQFRMALR